MNHDARPREVSASGQEPARWGLSDWLWLALAVLGLGAFAVLTWLVAIRVTLPFDGPLRDVALGWNGWQVAWKVLSEAANIPLIVIGVALVAVLLWQRRRREALLVIVTLALVTAGSEGVKQLVARPRPPGTDTVVPGVVYSYPSGHELEAVTILGIVALLVWRSDWPRALRLGVALAVAVFCALVALARVAIDAHYPSDVLAGAVGGIGVLAVFAILSRGAARRPATPREDSPRRTERRRPMAGDATSAEPTSSSPASRWHEDPSEAAHASPDT
jgi:undecaprenyl-diphosphatase